MQPALKKKWLELIIIPEIICKHKPFVNKFVKFIKILFFGPRIWLYWQIRYFGFLRIMQIGQYN